APLRAKFGVVARNHRMGKWQSIFREPPDAQHRRLKANGLNQVPFETDLQQRRLISHGSAAPLILPSPTPDAARSRRGHAPEFRPSAGLSAVRSVRSDR